MQYYKHNKNGECKIKPADFKILPAQVHIFSQIRTLQVRAFAIYAKLSDKESFCYKIALKRGFDHDNWCALNRIFDHSLITIFGMLTIWNDLSFQLKLKLV